jgi:hypothetical protein
MTDFAVDLKKSFDAGAYFSLEAYEVLPDGKSVVRSDEDERLISVFEALRDSVDLTPPALIKAAEELRTAAPELFEKWLMHGMQVIGPDFSPNSATEFVETLNRTGQRDMACT